MTIVRVVDTTEGTHIVDAFDGKPLPFGESEAIKSLQEFARQHKENGPSGPTTRSDEDRQRMLEVENLIANPEIQRSVASAQERGANFKPT